MNNIKRYREEKALTRDQLGLELGLTGRYIAFLERGERTPSLNTALKISEYFGVKIEDIFLNNKCTKSTIEEGAKNAK